MFHETPLASDDIPLSVAFFTFLSYGVLLLVGYVKEFFAKTDIKEKNREVSEGRGECGRGV